MEICSGTGEWAVAQAKADEDVADWVAVELRPDRVYQTLVSMALQDARNLCVVSGDASVILGQHVSPESVSQVLINYPEPPLWSGGDGESKLHLLTDTFLGLVLEVLVAKGSLTILSDNLKYLQVLAQTFARIDGFQSAKKLDGVEIHEDIQGVKVFKGLPGPECGHSVLASSYFDRLWDNGKHTRRHFLFLRKSIF